MGWFLSGSGGGGWKLGEFAFRLDQPAPPRGGGIGVAVAFGPAGQDEAFREGEDVEVGVPRSGPGHVVHGGNPIGRDIGVGWLAR